MLFLASQSPRRRQLLEQIGLRFDIVDVRVPEHPLPEEDSLSYVRRVARDKAGAGLVALGANPQVVVLGADTEVILDDQIFGKPADAQDAARMLQALSGRSHQVVSAVACVSAGREAEVVCISQVTFASLSEQVISDYIATGEPMGKAGAYAIQGYAASFIADLSGSYSGVMGLPLFETTQLLRQFGIKGFGK